MLDEDLLLYFPYLHIIMQMNHVLECFIQIYLSVHTVY